MKEPLLSIGIIFKNEIRCLERCLTSLQPLRGAIPCELVMADTGATDGSRAVAEKYADILIDFPWINDFAAARNAVMDRCSGTWYMTIDCDEWVDEKIQGFVRFLTGNHGYDFGSLIIRNYYSKELDKGGGYSDFMAVRLLRMSTGLRYEGTIHEHWAYEGKLMSLLVTDGLFHHDGYMYQDPSKQREKQERNMALLRTQLEADPDNLIVLTQCIESGDNMPEQEDYLRRALKGVEERRSQWELFGPPIYRCAVRFALAKNLPELEDWIREAETKFPDSIFTRVETAYFAFGHAWNKDNYAEAIRWGEKYLQGVADYEAGRFDHADILASSLNKADSHSRLNVATVLASGYLHEKQPEKCLRLMESFNGREMNAKQAGDCVRNLCNLHANFGAETAPLLLRLWSEINEPVPTQERAVQRRAAFLEVGEGMFEAEFIQDEPLSEDFVNHAYGVFRPLLGECELGVAAAMLETEDRTALEQLLCGVKDLNKLPVQALYHAIECGATFPMAEKPLKIEEMETLARRMSQDKEALFRLAVTDEHERGNRQDAMWVMALSKTAVSVFNWSLDGDGLELARVFARGEGVFLSLCYAPEALRKENLDILPPVHRFGWYLIRAFEALDAGDAAGYVRLLRVGLETHEGAKPMVEFLTEHTPELQASLPSPELLALADQIRAVLEKFSPDDPAVIALKQSAAYQKVAHLIEGAPAPIWGGQAQ